MSYRMPLLCGQICTAGSRVRAGGCRQGKDLTFSRRVFYCLAYLVRCCLRVFWVVF